MINILSLPFEYKQHQYKALVAIKKYLNHKEYRITIMNGELEKKFFGHHIIIEKSGRFIADRGAEDGDIQGLQDAIIQALTDHYEKLMVYEKGKFCNN